jgi:hypothetical protein
MADVIEMADTAAASTPSTAIDCGLCNNPSCLNDGCAYFVANDLAKYGVQPNTEVWAHSE